MNRVTLCVCLKVSHYNMPDLECRYLYLLSKSKLNR